MRLQFALARDLGMVHVDSSEFELALLNIVLNARDAIPKDGVVTISAENRQLEAGRAPDGLGGDFVLSGERQRRGHVAGSDVARVRSFLHDQANGQGTGLGLSMIYGFTRQSGGYGQKFNPEVGKGTTLSSSICRARTIRGPAPTMTKPRPARRLARCCSSRTMPTWPRSARPCLSKIGYTVRLAADARQALLLFEAEEFDLVVSDIVMPGGMNGIELVEELRHRSPGLPIVLASGYAASASAAPW